MKSSGRIHVVIGVLAAVFLCAPLLAAEKKLVFAKSAAWSATAYLYLNPDAPDSVSVNVGCLSSAAVSLEPGSVKVFADPASRFLCNAVPQFGTIAAPEGVGSFSRLSFDDGVNRSSFIVPPIGSVTSTQPATFFPVVVSDDESAVITVFPSEATQVSVSFAGATSTFTALPPVTQYSVPTEGAGVLTISLPQLVCGFCPVPKPLFGFVANGDSRGGNLRILPF